MRGTNSEKKKTRPKTTFLGLLRDEMGLKSRHPQKARLTPLPNVPTNFGFLAELGGELSEEQTKKIRKSRQKTTSLGLRGVEMGLKSRDHQKAHLELLLNVHT